MASLLEQELTEQRRPTKSAEIRRLLREGLTPRQIHRQYGHDYSTIRSATQHGDKRGRPRNVTPATP